MSMRKLTKPAWSLRRLFKRGVIVPSKDFAVENLKDGRQQVKLRKR